MVLKVLLGYFQKHLSTVLDPCFTLKKHLFFMTGEHNHFSVKGSELRITGVVPSTSTHLIPSHFGEKLGIDTKCSQ